MIAWNTIFVDLYEIARLEDILCLNSQAFYSDFRTDKRVLEFHELHMSKEQNYWKHVKAQNVLKKHSVKAEELKEIFDATNATAI